MYILKRHDHCRTYLMNAASPEAVARFAKDKFHVSTSRIESVERTGFAAADTIFGDNPLTQVWSVKSFFQGKLQFYIVVTPQG